MTELAVQSWAILTVKTPLLDRVRVMTEGDPIRCPRHFATIRSAFRFSASRFLASAFSAFSRSALYLASSRSQASAFSRSSTSAFSRSARSASRSASYLAIGFSCVRVRTRRYSLPNSDNPNLHPMMNEMTKPTVPMIVAIMENILALLECS